MNTRLSALVDGESDPQESAAVLDDVRRHENVRKTAAAYFLIGDVLRGEEHLEADFTASVMARLADEPTVLAPRMPLRGRLEHLRPALAVAASAAGVAIVGWLALASPPPEDRSFLARATVPPAPSRGPAIATVASQTPSPDMQEYLIAHQVQSSGLHLSNGAHQIRTVSFGDAGVGK
jgi:sigma-E factor negative regulatory protein RseA